MTNKNQTISRFVATIGISVSVLQGIFFGLTGISAALNLIAVFIALATLRVGWTYLTKRDARRFWLFIGLCSVQFACFVIKLMNTELPPPFRLLQVTIVVLNGVMLAGWLASKILAPANAFLLSLSVAFSVFFAEGVLEFTIPAIAKPRVQKELRWTNAVQPHPELGYHHIPNSVRRLYYPDNPRGYFKVEEDPRESIWQLQVNPGNTAELIFPPEHPERVQVAIEKAAAENPWEIQLNQPKLRVKANQRYAVSFRARADRDRTLVVAFAKAHEPWGALGLRKPLDLTTEWQAFNEEFVATETDANARIQFDLAASDIPVEVSDVKLKHLPDGTVIEPELPTDQYFVNYRFNALGCRGRDYAIPKPNGTVRIVALGDSYTLGFGVHEEDTFVYQLEHLLNAQAGASDAENIYEVINCGAGGYSTAQERLFYRLFASKYEPDIILLVLMSNDNLSSFEEEALGYTYRPGRFEHLFYAWWCIQLYRHKKPLDFSNSLRETLQLEHELQQQDVPLGVVFFRNFVGDPAWEHLMETITRGLEGTDVPTLDVGEALFRNHSVEELFVHKQIDLHPNEIAHGIAAKALLKFLQSEGLLNAQ
jgi:hypothetical protein